MCRPLHPPRRTPGLWIDGGVPSAEERWVLIFPGPAALRAGFDKSLQRVIPVKQQIPRGKAARDDKQIIDRLDDETECAALGIERLGL